MLRSTLVLVLLAPLLLPSCVKNVPRPAPSVGAPSFRMMSPLASLPPPVVPDPERKLWVDVRAADGGDGSREKPLRDLSKALEPSEAPADIQLAPGRYVGAWKLPAGTVLRGSDGVEFTVEGVGGTAVEFSGPARLERVTISGGDVGLRSLAGGVVQNVRFESQLEASVVALGGSLWLEAVRLRTSEHRTPKSLSVSNGAQATLVDAIIEGPFELGIDVEESSTLMARGLRIEGASASLRSTRARAQLEDVSLFPGEGVGLGIRGGELRAADVRVYGGKMGLQANDGARIEGEGFSFAQPSQSGVTAIQSELHLSEVFVSESGPLGAIQLIRSDSEVDGLVVMGGRDYAVNALSGKLHLRNASIWRIRDVSSSAGDALHLRDVDARVEGLSATSIGGSCVLAAQGTTLQLVDAFMQNCNWAAFFVDTGAKVDGAQVWVQEPTGPVVAMPAPGEVTLTRVEGRKLGAGWTKVDCQPGASVTLSGVRGPPVPPRPCVKSGDAAAPTKP